MKGRRIVNTRAVHQAQALNDLLIARDAEPLAYPCIAIEPGADTTRLDAALIELAAEQYDWLILTSANTVYTLAERLKILKLTLPAIQLAAVGKATAQLAVEQLKLPVTFIPAISTAESLAETLPLATGARIFVPASTLAPPTLAAILTERGAVVTVVPAYSTVRGTGGVNLPDLLHRGQVDAITLTSSSTVTYLLERLKAESASIPALNSVCIACIGSETAAAAQACGLKVDVMPAAYTLSGLVEALAQFFDDLHGKLS